MRTEGAPIHEQNPNQFWVAMRPDTPSGLHKEEYDNISWSSNLPYGKQLEIDVLTVNKTLNDLGFGFAVEIANFQPPQDKEEPPIASAGNNQATIAFCPTKPKKIFESNYVYDPETNKATVFINFSGIAKQTATSLKDGLSDPDFPQLYGKKINNAFAGQLVPLCIRNFFNLNENPIIINELIAATIAFGGFLMLSALETRKDEVNNFLGNLFVNLSFTPVIFGILNLIKLLLKDSKPNSYKSYLQTMLFNSEKLSDLLKFFYPHHFVDNLFIPLLKSFEPRKLIKGRISTIPTPGVG